MHSLPQHYTKRPHLAFLAEASQILSRSLDPLVTIDEVARLYVPYIADLCVVDLVEGGAWRRLGVAHIDDRKRERLREMGALPRSELVKQVLRRGEPVFMPQVDAEALIGYVADDVGATSAILLPLGAGGRVFGVMCLTCWESSREFTEEDFVLAAEVARRASTSIDNARLFHEAECARTEAELARQRSVFLSRVSDSLSAQVDVQEVIDEVARLAIDALSDGCLIDCSVSGQAAPYAVAHRHDAAESLLRDFFIEQRSELPTTQAFLEEAHARLGVATWHASPLVVRGEVMGTVAFLRDNADEVFSEEDVDLADQLLRRTASAVDRAWLFADLQKAVRVRDDFLSIASHELRTPLTALELQLGNLSRLMQKPDPLQWHTRFSDKLERANRQTLRITKLIDNLLDVSRISAGRFRLEPEECDLARLCHDVVERWTDEATAAGCDLEMHLETPCEGRWDPMRIEQVFTNLLSNAVKYGAGKPIHFALRSSEDGVSIAVRDQGIGVAQDALERIFDRFERAVSPREFCGLGLGLFITRQIVEAHGGAISVSSTLGTGSTFEVNLPRYVAISQSADPTLSLLADL